MGKLPSPTSIPFISTVHRAFYEQMPAEFRFLERPDGTKAEIVPGAFRAAPEEDVTVGRHRPPAPDRVAAFMEHFARRFAAAEKSASTRIIAIASAHHRLNYIHPFPDGNGRVSRPLSHAMALRAAIGGAALRSSHRGLSRGLQDWDEYKRLLENADSPRCDDLVSRDRKRNRRHCSH